MSAKKMYAALSLLVLLAMALSSCGGAATEAPAETEAPAAVETEAPVAEADAPAALPESYRIGLVGPFTGPNSVWGLNYVHGAVMAMEELNRAGGINGVPIELIIEDMRGNTADAITAIHKLVEVDGVPVILGPDGSGTTLAVCGLAEELNFVLLDILASSSRLEPECPDNFFQMVTDDAAQGPDFVNMLQTLGITSVPAVYVNSEYGVGTRDNTLAALEAAGITVPLVQPYEEGATDFRTEILMLRELNPAAVILIGLPQEHGLIMRQAAELGFQTQWIGDMTMVAPEPIQIAGASSEGAIAHTPANYDTPEYREFEGRFLARWGFAPGHGAEFAYDDLMIAAMAIEEGGYTTEGIRDAIRIVAQDYVGPSGPKALVEGLNKVIPYYGQYIVENGEWVTWQH